MRPPDSSGASRCYTNDGRARHRTPRPTDQFSYCAWCETFVSSRRRRCHRLRVVHRPDRIFGQTGAYGAGVRLGLPARSDRKDRRHPATNLCCCHQGRRDPKRTSDSIPRSRSKLRASSSRAVRSPLSICSCTSRSSIERFSCCSFATDRFNSTFSNSRWLRLVFIWPTVGPPVRKPDRPEQPVAIHTVAVKRAPTARIHSALAADFAADRRSSLDSCGAVTE